MTITYTPYCGKRSRVLAVHKADIILSDHHIEVVLRYDYQHEGGPEDYVKVACIMPKANLVITRNEMAPVDDTNSDDIIEAVFLECPGTAPIHIKCETAKEANEIYQKIKKWMIS